MAQNLLESYKNRLAIAESVHQRSHNGAKMSNQKKLMIASVLNNTSKFLNEAFNATQGGERGMIGDYKKFCLNVATTALPNLILPELMLVQPMSSLSGYVTYLKYTAGTTRNGQVANESLFNSPYGMGKMDEERAGYTSSSVVETVTGGEAFAPAWEPIAGTVKFFINGAWGAAGNAPEEVPMNATKVAYQYNNIIVPQDNLPTLTAKMEAVQLTAKARRIAVYYSQIAAFQAKTDYGTDLGEQLSAQAQGELAYEIDTEGVFMLTNAAEVEDDLKFASYEDAVENSANGVYISRSQYFEGLGEILARAKRVIYTRTQKFAPNYMIVGANVLTVLPYVKGWVAAPASVVNGPYFAGTIDGMKVFVSPAIEPNKMVFGVNGSDLQTSAAVYAPYMAIVPTQLLGFADGTMSQGFSTMYDMKLLSTYEKEGKEYSWLLCAGEINAE